MHTEHVDRMRAEGLLTEAQAQALHDSLSPPAADAGESPRRVLPTTAIAAVLGVVALLVPAMMLFGSAGGGGEIQNVSEMLNVPGGTGAMNNNLSALAGAALLLLPLALILLAFAWLHNGMVDKEERVYVSWSQVESNLQRRTDLIPNLVETVSRYLKHERDTLTGVTDRRAEALDPLAHAMDRLITDARVAGPGVEVTLEDEEALARLAQAQQALSGSLGNLVAVAESYPDLRSADQFLALQAQLEGTENRINVSRMEFNTAVGEFNSAIRRLPGSVIAGLGNFRRKAYFQAEAGAEARAALDFGQE